MKIRRIIASLGTVILLLAMLAAIISFVFFTDSQYEKSYYGELPKMYTNLKNTKGRKIVILGNSNIAFGVDSELIEKELSKDGKDYKVCNFGLYGALGTKVMLDLSRNYIQEGDIVVFSPEITAQSLSLYFSGLDTWRGIDGHFEMLWDLDNQDASVMVGAYSTFLAEKMTYLQNGNTADSGLVYSTASFNERCDMKNADRGYNVLVGGYDANNLISLDENLFTDVFCDYVNEYYREIKKAGAEMYFTFTPMNERSIMDKSKERIDAFYSAIEAKLDCSIISDPNAYIMDNEWFYDSNFHLNEAGMTYRSILLTEDLKNVFGLTAPVTVEIPEKPQAPVEEVISGNNDFVKYFQYEERNSSYVITSLTEEGKGLTKITVPVSYEGKQIVAFDREVFKGNTVIREITVQKNIKTLADNSFDGCTSLQKLILEQTSPEKISVGYQLLQGAESCFIYIKQEAVTAYLNNYFWGGYTGRFKVA